MDKFYRFKIVDYTEAGNNPKLKLFEYDLIRETPKGYWIGSKGFTAGYKWVPRESKKRYAYPTEEEALVNYIMRTKRRIKILGHQLDDCKVGLELAEKKFYGFIEIL
jgi:hypothetical protein